MRRRPSTSASSPPLPGLTTRPQTTRPARCWAGSRPIPAGCRTSKPATTSTDHEPHLARPPIENSLPELNRGIVLVITTPTGQIGRQTLTHLLASDESTRVIVRDASRLDPDGRDRVEIAEGSHGDESVLTRALDGAEALLWLVPRGLEGVTARERYLDLTRPAAGAIRAHGVGHVVGISSAGHGWPTSAGVLSAAFAMDAEIERTGVAYRALSMPAYMENLLGQVGAIRDHGTLAMAYDADRVIALVATRDIAAVAAALLTDRSWEGQQNLPVFGPDHLSPVQMAEVISGLLGSAVTYTRLALADVAAAAPERGASEGVARDMVEMTSPQCPGIFDADQAAATPVPANFL